MSADFAPPSLDAQLQGADWIVDALLGTGARGEPRSPLDRIIDQLNAHPARILAVDVPSGLDCETGSAARHAVRATDTCTFVAAKPGLLSAQASPYVGALHVLDIGTPSKLLRQFGIRPQRREQGVRPNMDGPIV